MPRRLTAWGPARARWTPGPSGAVRGTKGDTARNRAGGRRSAPYPAGAVGDRCVAGAGHAKGNRSQHPAVTGWRPRSYALGAAGFPFRPGPLPPASVFRPVHGRLASPATPGDGGRQGRETACRVLVPVRDEVAGIASERPLPQRQRSGSTSRCRGRTDPPRPGGTRAGGSCRPAGGAALPGPRQLPPAPSRVSASSPPR